MREPLDLFLDEAGELGAKLACLLVQLPPSLEFDAGVAEEFFGLLRERFGAGIACEPRHSSWLAREAEDLLAAMRVARVAADPDKPAGAGAPGGWPGLVYHRLHGSPRVYYSSYPPETLGALARTIRAEAAAGAECWCIFDNTASGAAAGDALQVLPQLHP